MSVRYPSLEPCMPIYEYRCDMHGPFDEIRSFSQADAPLACPVCAGPTSRLISIPHLRGMERSTRVAMERTERSRHQPHVCHSGCGHQRRAAASEQDAARKTALRDYQGPRPWVIEHA